MPIAMNLRAAEDWRGSRIARRYMLQTILTPSSNAANTNLLGLRKLAANQEVYISRIRTHVHFSAAIATPALPSTLGWKRATSVAAGTQMTAADIPKCDTSAANATLEVRTGSPTGTKANQYMLTTQAAATATPATGAGGGFLDDWTARDLSERIHLTGDEGLMLESIIGMDVDTRVHCLLVWEEVST